MPARVRDEAGMGLIELLGAMAVMTIALLALMAAFDTSALSLHKAQQQTTAATIGQNELEAYRALAYANIGLDQTTLTAIQTSGGPSYDATYVSDETALNNETTDPTFRAQIYDVTISSCTTSGGTASSCAPIQTVTGTDHHTYRVETFIRFVPYDNRRGERVVSVIVRDPNTSGSPEVFRITEMFDAGP